MDRRPGSIFPERSANGGKDKKGAPAESFEPKQPVSITADASAFEVLLRGASEEEARLLRRLLIEWSRGDENTFPHQLTLITLSQWRAAARVPLETAKVLQQHHATLEDSATRFVRAADAKLPEFQKAGKLIDHFERQIARLTTEGDEALKRMHEVTANLLRAEERFHAASKKQDVFFLVVVLLFVALMTFILGAVVCHVQEHGGW